MADAEPTTTHAPIQFAAPTGDGDGADAAPAAAPPLNDAALAELEEERERHRARASRFGTDYVDPARKPGPLRDAARIARAAAARPGFETGFNIHSEEERAKAAARAARFGTATAPTYAPSADLLERQQDLAKKQQRAERFGVECNAGDGLMEVDALEARRDAPLAADRRADAIHLYGVDLMSTSDCLAYFSEWGPRYVEWIDDSACNVVFADAHTAARAIVGRGTPLPPDSSAAPDTAGLDPTDLASAPFLWHQGEDFKKAGASIPLLYRMAAVTDVKPAGGGKMSRRLWRLPAAAGLEAVGRTEDAARARRRRDGGGVRGGVGKRRARRRREGDVEMVKGE